MILGSLGLAIFVGMKVQPYLGVAVFIAGVFLYSILWAWWFRYLLYGVKCAHVAVLTDLITRGKIGSGSESMLSYGRHVVSERVSDVAQLWVFQSMLRLVMIQFTLGIDFLSELMPFGIGFLARSGRRLLRASTQYLDEALFSYSLVRLSDPLWDACSEGLGYYFQNSKEILKTTVWMVFLNFLFRLALWLVFVVAWSLMLYGVALSILTAHAAAIQAWAGGDSPPDLPGLSVVCAAIAGLILTAITTSAINNSFLRPVSLTMIITKFLNVIQSQPLEPGFEQYVGSRGPRLQSLAAQIDA
ncbi:MAG: hypothetical protein ACRELY_12245, partial [Polyangiaceae bacterium]